MVSQFQKQKVDPLGLGAKYKEHFRGFNEKQWNEEYPNVKVYVHADVEILQTGSID
jgi:spore germination protein